MKDALTPIAALVFAVFAILSAWMSTFDIWTSGMSNLLILCSIFSTLGLIGCVLVDLDEQRNR
jgi:predicted permease